MPFPIEDKLVVGVSSNALFELTKEDEMFSRDGLRIYRQYQIDHKNDCLDKGLAFPFIRRLLRINEIYKDESPIEVVLFSKNSPETGIRIFNSIKSHGLNISRAAFTSGRSPFEYIPAYNISLFLSTNGNDVKNAIIAGYAAGRFLPTRVVDNEDDSELRVAFDFDGVIIDDEAEKVFKDTEQLKLFQQYEVEHVDEPHKQGPLADFFRKLSLFQQLESQKLQNDPKYKKILRTAIITARNAPAHERATNTLSSWGVTVDEMFLLGGIEKRRILEIMKPHIYFDDQQNHLDSSLRNIPLVHIPFGVTNNKNDDRH